MRGKTKATDFFTHSRKKKFFSEVNRFNKLHPELHLCKPLGLPSPNKMFPTSNSSPMRTTELKSYRRSVGSQKHRSTSSLQPKCLLWGAQGENNDQQGRGSSLETARQRLWHSKRKLWVKVHWAAAESTKVPDGPGPAGPRSRDPPRTRIPRPREWLQVRKGKHASSQEDGARMEFRRSLWHNLAASPSVSDIFREKHSLSFCSAVFWQIGRGGIPFPGQLEAKEPPSQSTLKTGASKLTERQNDCTLKKLIYSFANRIRGKTQAVAGYEPDFAFFQAKN